MFRNKRKLKLLKQKFVSVMTRISHIDAIKYEKMAAHLYSVSHINYSQHAQLEYVK